MDSERYGSDPVSDYALLDIDREKRLGFPEVIFGENKTVAYTTATIHKQIRKEHCSS